MKARCHGRVYRNGLGRRLMGAGVRYRAILMGGTSGRTSIPPGVPSVLAPSSWPDLGHKKKTPVVRGHSIARSSTSNRRPRLRAVRTTALLLEYKHCESETDDQVDAAAGVEPGKPRRTNPQSI